ncbi:MAG: hypothetical protein WBD10_12750 [Acidobacteriaceae bacterium]
MKMKIVAVSLLCAFCCALYAQDTRQLVKETVTSEVAADKADQSRWIYHEVDRKPGNVLVQWVAQTSQGDVNRIIKKNGHPIPEAQQRNSVESFVHDSSARARQRQADRKDGQEAEDLLNMLPQAFLWTLKNKNDITTIFHFKPDPKFSPPSRQARVFAAMEGDMTVNNRQHRIMRLRGTMIRDVNFGWGLLGSLKKGGSFEVNRKQTAPGIWQIYETHVHIQGRALLFKTISEQEDDIKTQFTRQADNVTLEQAAEAVLKQPNR